MTTTASPAVTYALQPYPGETTLLHTWAVLVDGQVVSTLYIDPTIGEVMNIETDAEHQRQGLASHLYATASASHLVLHAPESHRTPAGAAFAARVGGDALPCTHGCCDDESSDAGWDA